MEVFRYERPTVIYGDYEKSSYKLSRLKDKITFSFACGSFKDVFKINGVNMLKKYYPEFKVEPTPDNSYDLTLSFDLSEFPLLSIEKKENKDPGEEDDEEIKGKPKKKEVDNEEEKKADRKKEKAYIKEMHTRYEVPWKTAADKLTLFKRHFFALPFEYAFECANNGTPFKVGYSLRDNENIWIIAGKQTVSVYFGITFEDIVDRSIAKIILSEMEEAKKHAHNAPSVKYVEEKIPDGLITDFPEIKSSSAKFQNGVIVLTLFKDQLNYASATALQEFRHFIHYHIHASKTYLHGRLRKRIAILKSKIKSSKFEDETGKYYRTDKDELLKGDEEKEEKTSVIKKKL